MATDGLSPDSFGSIRPYCSSKEYDRYLRLKSLPPHPSPAISFTLRTHTYEHTHDAKPRQKLINDISLRAMSERHPRRLPGFLSEEDPGSFTSEREKERKRIQSEPWNTMVDTVNPGCRFDFIAALTPGNAVPPPVESSEFVHGFLAAFSWLFLYGSVIVLSCCILFLVG